MSIALLVALGLLPVVSADLESPKSLDPRLSIELFAEEPAIVTPTGIAVDSNGRVLVIESHTHFRPDDYEGPPADRILVLEDTNGDGQADAIGTYFEGTTHTMNLGVYQDGSVFVATRSEIFRLFDDVGDGLADRREPIARLDTRGDYPHNGLSGFAFDTNGDVYFGFGENLGVSYRLIGQDGKTLSGGGEGGNIYRIQPDGSGLERVATGFWNPFHIAFDAFGRLLAVDNDPDSRPPCRLLHIVEGGDYGYKFRYGRRGLHPFTAWNGELPGTLPMIAGTGEAPSGMVVYESDHLPSEYLGDVLATSWGDHRIERFRLLPAGASFRSALEPVIIGGENFRPVGIATAPDGSLFVSDWVDRSYHLHGKGRIWHIQAVEPSPRQVPEPLAERLEHPDRTIRESAARQLAGGADSERQALQHALKKNPDPRARAAALDALAVSNDRAIGDSLRDEAAEVRALAIRRADPECLDPARLALDPSPLVRAEALRRVRDAEAVPLLLEALDSSDPFLSHAARAGLGQAIDTEGLLDRVHVESARQRLGVLLVLRDSGDESARSALPGFLADPDPTIRFAAVHWVGEEGLHEHRDALTGVLEAGTVTSTLFEGYIAALERLDGVDRGPRDEIGGQDYVAALLQDSETPKAIRRLALRVLRPDHPSWTRTLVKECLESPDPGLRMEAVRSLRDGALKDREAMLAALAFDSEQPETLRAEALVGLAGTGPEHRERLLELVRDETASPSLRREALRSLRGQELDADRRAELVQAVSGDPAAEALAETLSAADRMPEVPEGLGLDDWLKRLEGPADPAEGRRVFFHPNGPGCARCHQVDGRGGPVGPDLSVIGETMDRSRLVESILDPSREIAPQFVPWLIALEDGTIATGLLIEETDDGEQVYADSEGNRFVIHPEQVEQRQPIDTSLMPAELVRAMTLQEFRDLIAYLQDPDAMDERARDSD